MPLNKGKLICNTLTMLVVAVAIVLLGFSSSYSSVAASPLQSVIHHHSKVFDKKQQDSASSGGGGDDSSSSKTKGSDKSNTESISNNNNIDKNYQRATNDGSSNSRQSVEPPKTGIEVERGGGENVAPPTVATVPTPESQTSCKQGSNCTDQQGLSDNERSSTTSSASTLEQDNSNTPFVLSLPFP